MKHLNISIIMLLIVFGLIVVVGSVIYYWRRWNKSIPLEKSQFSENLGENLFPNKELIKGKSYLMTSSERRVNDRDYLILDTNGDLIYAVRHRKNKDDKWMVKYHTIAKGGDNAYSLEAVDSDGKQFALVDKDNKVIVNVFNENLGQQIGNIALTPLGLTYEYYTDKNDQNSSGFKIIHARDSFNN